MKGEGSNGTIFTGHSSQNCNTQTTQMFPQLPSTSHNSAPFTNLWENQQQLQNYYQQYYNTPMTNQSTNSFQHSPLSTINIFAGYPTTLPSTFHNYPQQNNPPNFNLYENNQTRIDAGTASSSSSIYQQSPLAAMDSINLQIESNGRQFNPQWLFSAPKVCVSVNSYNLEDTKNISTTITKTKNNLLNNNSTNKLIPSTLLPQSSSHRPTRQIFGPGTNNLRVRTKDQYRIVYNEFQRIELEKAFVNLNYVTAEVKAELSSRLHLTERQIKIWFQNRRAKDRKQTKQLVNLKRQQQQNHHHLNNPHNLNYATFTLQNHHQQKI
uniref:Homeobox domain-containing protein n=1 Tax=Meloidogyne floridensis TaxID=298350 RepID=A0A915P7X0_9BILA